MEENNEVDEENDDEFFEDDHELCPFTGLTKREKAVIKDSWPFIQQRGSSNDHECSFFYWLLEHIPHLKSRMELKFPKKLPFHKFLVDEYLKTHSQAVLLTLDCFVYLIDSPESLKEKMRSIAKSHVEYKPSVGMEFFKPFEVNFDQFIQNCLSTSDVDENDERILIWVKLIRVFCRVVQEEQDIMKSKQFFPCCLVM